MKRKEEAGHGSSHRRYQEPFRPAIDAIAGEQSEQDDKAGKDRDQADQRVNDCVDVQYHFVTPSFAIVNRSQAPPLTAERVVLTQPPAFCRAAL